MKLKIYGDKLSNVVSERNLFGFGLVVLLIATIISGVISFYAINSRVTIILPPKVDKKIAIRTNDASDDYLYMIGSYSLNCLFNYTPTNITEQLDRFLDLTTPEYYANIREKLERTIEEVKRLNITSTCHINNMFRSPVKDELEISARVERKSDKTTIEEKAINYILEYSIDNGTFSIRGVSEKK